MERLNTGEPRALICLHQEPQRRNEAEDLLQLQHHVDHLSHAQRVLEEAYNSLQQAELLDGIISDQDLRTLCTACHGLNSLRIRVEARANILERAVIKRQLHLIQMRVQPCPTEDTHTADTSCFSRTSAEQVGESPVPVDEGSSHEPDPMRPS